MLINHNISGLNTFNKLNKNNKKTSSSMEKLSSGLRINKASDDSAGLAISEKMRTQIRGLKQAQRNIQDGISLIQTAEGGLSDIQEPNLLRLRELAIQSANDTLTNEDRQQIQKEVEQIKNGINEIAGNTEYNGINLLNGSATFTTIPPTPQSTFSTTGGGAGHNVSDGWVNVGVYGAKVKLNPGEQVIDDPANWLFSKLQLYADIVNGAPVSFNIMSTDGYVVVDNHPLTPFEYNGMTFDISNLSVPSGTGNMHQGNIILTAGNNDGILNNDIDNRIKLQIGSNSGENFPFELTDARTTALGINNIDLSTRQGAESALLKIDKAMEKVSSERGKFGAYQNRLEHALNNASNYEINLTASESRIRDADIAKEMMELTKTNILSQASQTMLAQANQQPQAVLQLLK
ncbi:flagellin [Bacillus sp. 31A1R]|uniref:Flagellin n=1 Tax=Robertmurraya mangrovi TaxID=3098077 RepID=A0ABU5J400_9BACI|nr:flagellin [Bacillus sp. 31A1R]MDZ5474156.1 flagellin [Bacillus sp. 31A1R]